MKRCIFCKAHSGASKTIEHIIPESFGNVEHVLPAGVVCDACNNYFSREVEKPLLDSDYFTHARFRMDIASKKGVIPSIWGIHLGSRSIVGVSKESDGKAIYPLNPKDESRFIQNIRASTGGTLIIPVPVEPDSYVISRFLGKVAIEVLAQRALQASVPEGLDEIIDKRELDDLRNHVRRGHPKKTPWAFHQRRIYPEEETFYEEGYGHYQVLHEYTLLYTDKKELYFVLALLGLEFVINMAGSDIGGYLDWLRRNGNRSPLYV